MKKAWISLTLALVLLLCVVPVSMADGYFYIDCDGSYVNLREGPSQDYVVLTHVPYAAQVLVIEDQFGGDYAHCVYDGYYGYISWNFLSSSYPEPQPTYGPLPAPTAQPAPKPVDVLEYKYVTSDNRGAVNMRTGPSTSYASIARVPYGAQVSIYSYTGAWAYVGYNGVYGYMSTRYLSYTKGSGGSTQPTAKPVVTAAPAGNFENLFANFAPKHMTVVVAPSADSGHVNLRWAPTTEAPVIATYEKGVTLDALWTNGEWMLVYDAENATAGFMMNKYLSTGDGLNAG